MKEIPVYLITGFLDGGKTSFINDILGEGFADDGRTLLICCEEGEVEYTHKALNSVRLVKIDEEEKLSHDDFVSMHKKYRPTQVIIEYNGMWLLDSLLDELPKNWLLYQVMTFVDGKTFEPYSSNLGQLMMEKIKMADMLVFNRCTDDLKVRLRKRNLRLVNRQADIFLEGMDGKAENYLTGDECYFDLSQPVIEIPDDDFGLWFVEMMEHPERYKGKTVHLKLQMNRVTQMPNVMIPGRTVMTCCEADMAFYGIMSTGDIEQYKNGQWLDITAEGDLILHPAYDFKEGPVLRVKSAVPCSKPEREVVSF